MRLARERERERASERERARERERERAREREGERERERQEEKGVGIERGPLRAVHLSRHKWPGGSRNRPDYMVWVRTSAVPSDIWREERRR